MGDESSPHEKILIKKWLKLDIDILIEEYNKGTSFKDISNIMNRTYGSIEGKVKHLHLPKRMRGHWSEEDNIKLVDLYNSNMSFEDISNKLNRTIATTRSQISKVTTCNRIKKWSKEDINILKIEYEKGTSSKVISHMLGRNFQNIKTKASSLGITNDTSNPWTEEEIRILTEMKINKSCSKEIEKTLNRTKGSVRKKIGKLGLAKVPYVMDCNYFDEIKTQKQAYWLGWLISDGCVSKSDNRISLRLAANDVCVLEDLKRDIKATHEIKRYKAPKNRCIRGVKVKNSQDSVILTISSRKMRSDLSLYGIVPNKTYITKFPENLNTKYYPGFISGMISGDGWVHNYTRNNILRGGLVGTESIVKSVRDVLIEYCGYNPNKSAYKDKRSKDMFSLEFSHKQILKLYLWLKNNNVLLMPRKNKIIEDYIDKYPYKCRGIA